jgi:hypothetical protein
MVKTALIVILLAAPAYAKPGFTATAGGGTNVDTPFVEVQIGRRFRRAPFFELFLDYSYDRPISLFSFQTFGLGVRTYFWKFDRFEMFHQAMAAFAISSSGRGPVQDREIGERLLGAFLTQGVGVQAAINPCWNVALTVNTGTPVWLRPELSVRFTW